MSNKICNIGHFESMDDVNLFLRACELKGLEWNRGKKPTEHSPQSIPLSINIWDDNTITHSSVSKPDIDFRDKIKEMCPNYIVSTKDKMDIPGLVSYGSYCNGESVRIENGKIEGSQTPDYYNDKKSTHLFVTADEYNRIMKNDEQSNPIFGIGVTGLIRDKEAVYTGSSVSYSGGIAESPYSTAKSDPACTGTLPSLMSSRDMLQDTVKKYRLTFKKVL